MRGYERDEYENFDEYEEDGEEQEEEEGNEYGYEETRQPTQEELEYLELRERLKESIRKQMKKESGTANAGTRGKVNAFRKDNYGSFFGPSQPVIAQRVIQESKSLLENPHLVARISRPNHANKKSSVSAFVSSKPRASCTPNVSNGLKKKVEMLKNTRDYSFLLSEDAEIPSSMKNPPSRNVSGPKSDARSAQVSQRSKLVNNQGSVPNGHDRREQVPASSQSRPRIALEKMDPVGKSSVESRKLLGGNNGSGPGRPPGSKGGVPSKGPGSKSEKVTPHVAKNTAASVSKPARLPLQASARKPTSTHLQSGVNRRAPSQGEAFHSKNSLVASKEHQGTSKPKVTKLALPSSRDQIKRAPPIPAARGTLSDERVKAKPRRPLYDEDPDGVNAINMIRQMFRYNPNKFRDDDDDSDMEANFEDIMREEKRSEKIARKEDEEQLRLIEEEARRERMRLAKKRKLSHH